MNELDAKKGKFLMRRIEYTPDYANIYCDVNIKWLQEIYFNSIICMPKMLFGDKNFNEYYAFSNFISIELEEWEKFMNKIVSSFRTNNELKSKVIKNVNDYLEMIEKFTNEVYNRWFVSKKMPTSQDVRKIFEYFSQMDSFAVFNMYIPTNYYNKILDKLKMPREYSNIDLTMVCSFLPHRLQVRKSKLNLLKDYINKEKDLDIEIKDYLLNYAVYEKFEAIAFDNSFLKNDIYLKRELKSMAGKYSLEQIEREFYEIDVSRKTQISSMKKFYENLDKCLIMMDESEKENIINTFAFLILIVSEEERRHMIECKMFAILAEVFAYIDIDVSRARIEDVVNIYSKLWEE